MACRAGLGEIADPVVGVVRAGDPQNLRARRHALAELLGKGRQRGFVDAERAQAVPGEGDGHPSGVGRS